jgi:hypothetical protein
VESVNDGPVTLVVDTDQPSAVLQQLTPYAQHLLTLDGECLVLVLCS